MSSELIAEGGKLLGSALFGGLITAATALPYLNNKVVKLTGEVENMKNACTLCRAEVNTKIVKLADDVTEHHSDPDKHTTKSSETLLRDILDRVVRIENRLFNGGSKQ